MSSPDSSDAAIVDELVRKVQLESASGGPGPKLYAAPPSQPKTREDMWFIHWNVNNDPKEISCTVALDTAVWCIGEALYTALRASVSPLIEQADMSDPQAKTTSFDPYT